MNIRKLMLLSVSHLSIGVLGFSLGIYALPILIAPSSPTVSEINRMSLNALYKANFKLDLKDSDAFHWGEGEVSIGQKNISFEGELAPGPDYKLYLSPKFVETENDFNQLKSSMVKIGEVRTFNNFIVEVPTGIDVTEFNTVIVWCETFGEFITSAQYR